MKLAGIVCIGSSAAILVAACGIGGGPGDQATWFPESGSPMPADQQTFTALVTRLGCSGGSTGDVLAPTIEIEPERIVVTFTVEALDPDEFQKCPGNMPVAATVDLGEQRGDRPIVDGTCSEKSVNFTLYVCEPDGERVSASGSAVTDPFTVQG